MKGVSIIIPTYNGGITFKKLLDVIIKQEYDGEMQIIVIDSGSSDGTCEEAINVGADLIRIDKNDFHHSRTRNQAVLNAVHPYIVLMVQDAIPLTGTWLTNMVNSIEKDDVVGVYGKQIPHNDADLYAKFSVDNHSIYLGDKANVQEIGSMDEFNKLSYQDALYKIRFDDVCAIYKYEILSANKLPEVVFAEDMAWAFEVMKKGYKVKYDPTIMVSHSHNRNKEYHFRRAIIDSISCVRILGKEIEDYSRWTAKDLLALRDIMDIVVKKMLFRLGENDINDFKTAARISLLKKLLLKIAKRFRRPIIALASFQSFNSIDVMIKKRILEEQMNSMVNLVLVRYQNNEEDVKDYIEKAAAAIVGNYWGRVYGSCELRGYLPSEIEELVQPYLMGV